MDAERPACDAIADAAEYLDSSTLDTFVMTTA
jgi:hypothetical protein